MQSISNIYRMQWIKNTLLCLLLVSAASSAHEEQDEKVAVDEEVAVDEKVAVRKPEKEPLVELTRTGHLDTSARKRTLAWSANDLKNIASIEVRVVKVEMQSMEATELFSSKELKGMVEVTEFQRGPGVYALLVKAKSRDGQKTTTGIRLSYTEVNPKCPDDEAWWPRTRRTKSAAGRGEIAKQVLQGRGPNLLGLSLQASYVVTATATDFISCPTKEGSLFTYVVFRDVNTLQQEIDSETVPALLLLRIPGGMAHGRVELVTDAPVFKVRDQVILFLTRDPQQQVPIVEGTRGVLFIENNRVRSYAGPSVTGIGKDFRIELDPGYKPKRKHARHWDPNMKAVWRAPKASTSIGNPQPKEKRRRQALSLEQFSKQLSKAWVAADGIGRIPKRLDTARRPYNKAPSAPSKRVKTLSKRVKN